MEQQIDSADSQDNENDSCGITIQAVRRKTRDLISALLNPVKVIRTEKGLPRDWQGLAELCGIPGERIPSLQSNSDPSNKILDIWLEKSTTDATIDKFIDYLEQLDRFDVIDDVRELLDEDVAFYRQNPNGLKPPNLNLDADRDIITIDDVKNYEQGLELQKYDAFILFSEDDIEFVTKVLDMEKQYNLKFCVKERDLLGGGYEHEAVIRLIAERCNRLIVILSPAFFESSANKFFYSFAQAIGIEQRKRKIVPCIYKKCDKIPTELSCYFMLDYNRSGVLWNFWDKLYGSIVSPVSGCQDKTTNTHSVVRSTSQYNSQTHRNRTNITRSAIHFENGNNLRPLSHAVRFNSMCNLSTTDTDNIIRDESLLPSTSATSLGGEPDVGCQKKKHSRSFYDKFKTKLKKNKSPDVQKAKENGNCKNNNECQLIEVTPAEKTEKKKFWSLKRSSKRK